MEQELMDMIKVELETLHGIHPFINPGEWDVAVNNINALRTAIYTSRDQKMKASLPKAG